MKKLSITFIMIASLLVLAVMPTMAQQPTTPNTITVTGIGSASGAPDIANLEIGVETTNADLAVAYDQTNERIDTVINALVEAGVAREDIRTVGLNVYQDRYGGPNPQISEDGNPTPMYFVSNNIRVTVRDIANVPTVLNAAIDAGANNIYGLNFGIEDTDALASEARAAALADARQKAQELAGLAEVQLGSIVNIVETSGGFDPYNQFAMESAGLGGGGGATVEPGQLSVNVQLQVTFSIGG
ncbi:MAG: SIMPL domain-containing protein [Anaerolineae bacterium]|nr:SIMPL domain-containing protein [Anaerolineae bacterium]